MAKAQRIEKLRAKLEEQDLAGLFVSAPAEDIHHTIGANRRYLSGFSGSMGHLLITRDNAYIAVDSRYSKIMRVMRESEQRRPRLRRLGDADRVQVPGRHAQQQQQTEDRHHPPHAAHDPAAVEVI